MYLFIKVIKKILLIFPIIFVHKIYMNLKVKSYAFISRLNSGKQNYSSNYTMKKFIKNE